MGKEYLEITPEMEAEWKDGEFVLFDYDCGSGKTTGIANWAVTHPAEGVLYLVPRKTLLQSVENKMAEVGADNVTVMTIQSLAFIPQKQFLYRAYKYICIDEMQQVVLDSPYNKNMGCTVTDIVHNFKGITMMLTGTDVGIEFLFKMAYGIDVKTYRKKLGYADYLTGDVFAFVPNIGAVVDIIYKKLQKNEKVLFFSSTIENIETVQSQLVDKDKSMVVVSEYSKHSDRLCGRKRKRVKELIDDEVVPKGISVVLATKALDTGVNIKNSKDGNSSEDGDLNTVIIDSIEIATAIQEINRRRREDGDCIDVYFLLPNGYVLKNNREKYEEELQDYHLYQNDFEAWLTKHQGKRFSNRGIVYTEPGSDGADYKIDYAYLMYCHYMLNTSLRSNYVSDYKSAVEKAMGWASVTLPSVGKKTLEELVEYGVLSTKEEKQWLIDLFAKKFRSATYLNMLLREMNLPYEIKTKVHVELPPVNGKRKENRSGWQLVRTDGK